MPLNTNQQISTVSGVAQLSVANPNLDGTGVLVPVITGANDGTVIKRITVQCTQDNIQGAIRLFITDPVSLIPTLWREISVNPKTLNQPLGTIPATRVSIYPNITLGNSFVLSASTQNAENWNVVADGITWSNCKCS